MILALLALFSRAGATPPNIVFILTDDLDLQSIDQIPELRPLLQDAGVTYTHDYVSLSLCCPSRATILRGQYAHNTGIYWNTGRNGGYPRFVSTGDEASTLGTWMRGAGYDTALFGKYLNGYPEKGQERKVPAGWADWIVPVAGNPYGEFGYTLNTLGRFRRYGRAARAYLTDVLSQRAVEYIHAETSRKSPFFLYLATYAPHSPETPAPRYASLYPNAQAPRSPAFNEEDVSDKPSWLRNAPPLDPKRIADADARYRRRLQAMRAVVDLVAAVVQELTADGALSSTYLVFTSDNGYHFGEHRMHVGKNTEYETDLRVPLIVRGPGLRAGTVNDDLVVNTDFAPTFTALAGTQPPVCSDGRDFLHPAGPARQAFLIEHRGPAPEPGPAEDAPPSVLEPADPGNGPNEEGGTARVPVYVGVHTRDHVYVEFQNGERELYDLQKDPDELDNLASTAAAGLVGCLHDWLESLRHCSGASCRAAEDTAPGSCNGVE